MRRIALIAALAALWGCGGEDPEEGVYQGETVCPVVGGRDGRVCVPVPLTAETCIKLPKHSCGEEMIGECESVGEKCYAIYVPAGEISPGEYAWVAMESCMTPAEHKRCY